MRIALPRASLGSTAAFAALLACASNPAFLAEDAPSPLEVRRVLVLPANFDHAPPPVLAAGTELMDERIAGYLRDRGFSVESIRLSSLMSVWSQSTEAVGGIEGDGGEIDESRYEAAMAEVVRRALAERPADVVAMPTLRIRNGPVYSGRLVWDGAAREIPIESVEANIPIASISGEAPGVSLCVTLYDAHATRFFERFVGIESINALRLTRTHWQWKVRGDLFQDESILQWSVRAAFEPWLAAPVAASE